ncbi:MAG: single-stranded-DNA-specific exonuclease RecJ [Anaerolineae bacterium]|nr:single-stranded-DNA-specific exonuclease RecJ [Anaerolineae bacterium]
MDKIWEVAEKVPASIRQDLGDYPLILQQLLFNRGITSAAEAEVYLTASGSMYSPFRMLDMQPAVERIFKAVDNAEKIAIYGDYDVDGVTATALLVQILREYGAEARGYIPNRFDEGYGLNIEAIDFLAANGISLVITVDCGIRSPNEAEHARAIGLDLIISDHHEPKEVVPHAVAVICPKQAGDEYPEKNLAGVGLAYKIAEALHLTRPLRDITPEAWLDLVAVGTVADIVPLIGENRALVKTGLRQLRTGKRQGLLSLTGAAGSTPQMLTARDIGFTLGPRLNAAGRLESALASFDLLMATDVETAGLLAQKLDDQNKQRQEMTRQMQETAEGLAGVKDDDLIVFAASPDFNMGVVGLVAARLTETHYLPSVVGAFGEEFTRASCRSIPEFHITHALDECADLFERHGGHAMAAGFTVRNERLPELQERLKIIAQRELLGRELKPVLKADMEIALKDLKPEVLKLIDALEPTGHQNREALFVSRHLKVVRYRTVGSDQRHLRLTVSDGFVTYDAIAFRMGHFAGQMPEYVDLMYAYERNVFQGRESLQLNVRDLKAA